MYLKAVSCSYGFMLEVADDANFILRNCSLFNDLSIRQPAHIFFNYWQFVVHEVCCFFTFHVNRVRSLKNGNCVSELATACCHKVRNYSRSQKDMPHYLLYLLVPVRSRAVSLFSLGSTLFALQKEVRSLVKISLEICRDFHGRYPMLFSIIKIACVFYMFYLCFYFTAIEPDYSVSLF